MSYKYCPQRRLFLQQTSQSLGLLAASNLFAFKASAQANVKKKNLVCLYFLHSGNVDFPHTGGFGRGSFHAGNGGDLGALKSIQDDLVFIRGVDHTLNGQGKGENQHDINPASSLSGHSSQSRHSPQLLDLIDGDTDSGTSIDVIIGRHLQKQHPETKISHQLMSQADDIVGASSNGNFGVYRYRTCSTERVKGSGVTKVLYPTVNPMTIYNDIKKIQTCEQVDSGNINAKIKKLNQDIKNLEITENNLGDFRSNYLLPNEEYEKLESKIKIQMESKLAQIKQLNSGETVGIKCGELAQPGNYQKDIRNPNFENKARKHINDHFKLLAYSFKYNYTRSATVFANDWASDNKIAGQKFAGVLPQKDYMHSVAHAHVGNPSAKLYVERIGLIINDLVTTLKAEGLYEETMIVATCEYPHQNMGNDPSSNGGGLNHRSDNLPWLVINSGAKAADHNLGTKKLIHPGDIQIAIMDRFGINKSQWGTSNFGQNDQLGNGFKTAKRRGNRSLVGII